MRGVSLAQTQATLAEYFLDAGNDQRAALPLLADGFGLPRERRLDIYHNAYRARLHEALGTVFERTWAYLGDQEFATLAGRYIESHPSTRSNLRDYGEGFPALLAWELPDDPEAAELAWMDWNLHLAFDAPDVPRLLPEELALLSDKDWETAGFAFQPGLDIAVFDWNVVEVWHALDREAVPPPARRLERPVAYVFWRKELQSHFRSLEEAEHLVLMALLEGASFAQACEMLADDQPETVAMAGPWLQRWIADGMISRVVLPA